MRPHSRAVVAILDPLNLVSPLTLFPVTAFWFRAVGTVWGDRPWLSLLAWMSEVSAPSSQRYGYRATRPASRQLRETGIFSGPATERSSAAVRLSCSPDTAAPTEIPSKRSR